MKLLPFVTISTLALLTACIDIGGSDDDDNESKEYYGYFVDSGVMGLNYSPNNGTERTEGNGRFYYEPGQSTSFSILGLNLGSSVVESDSPVITPATLLGEGSLDKSEMETLLAGSSSTAQTIKNQLVLLQSLDYDQNPDNGINLPIPYELDGEFTPATDALSTLNLSDSATDFAAALQTKLAQLKTQGAVNFDTPVSEETAVAHFLSTLEDLESLAEYEGRWGMRSGSSGDLSAIYTFNSDLTIDLIEYDNCPGQLYGASEETLKAHCTPVTIEQTFSSNGTQLILENDNISDTCITLSSNSHEVFASCDFEGSGLGSEVIRLQRAPLAFSNIALHSQYTELQAGSSTITTFNFNTQTNTGSYSSTDESGNITWQFINNNASLQFTTDVDVTTDQFNYLGFVKGAWLTGSASNVTNILRNIENTTSAGLLDISGFFGVFDLTPGSATEGQCKEVRIANNTNTLNDNQVAFDTYDNASGNTYSCDYPTNYEELTATSETFNISSGFLENSENSRRCYLLGIDDYEVDNLYVACEKSSNQDVFEIELWRGL